MSAKLIFDEQENDVVMRIKLVAPYIWLVEEGPFFSERESDALLAGYYYEDETNRIDGNGPFATLEEADQALGEYEVGMESLGQMVMMRREKS